MSDNVTVDEEVEEVSELTKVVIGSIIWVIISFIITYLNVSSLDDQVSDLKETIKAQGKMLKEHDIFVTNEIIERVTHREETAREEAERLVAQMRAAAERELLERAFNE